MTYMVAGLVWLIFFLSISLFIFIFYSYYYQSPIFYLLCYLLLPIYLFIILLFTHLFIIIILSFFKIFIHLSDLIIWCLYREIYQRERKNFEIGQTLKRKGTLLGVIEDHLWRVEHGIGSFWKKWDSLGDMHGLIFEIEKDFF